MSIKEYMDIIFGVLKSPYVIGTVIVMILVIQFAKYVASYKKKPPKSKNKKVAKTSTPALAQTEAKSEEGDNSEGEGEAASN